MSSTRVVHFMYRTWGDAQHAGLGALSPCVSLFRWQAGTPRKRWSCNVEEITCRHCLRTLARLTAAKLAARAP
jgi:hypothetical protein